MQLIWSMMNALQIIVHLPLLSLSFPQNAKQMSFIFMDLAEFDVLPHGWLNPAFFNFDNPEPISEKFSEVGYDTSNFILNAGSVFWFIIMWVLLALAIKAIAKCFRSKPKIMAFSEKVHRVVFFTLIIRIGLESYLELLISALINIKEMKWNFSGESIASSLAAIFSIIFLISPQLLHYVLMTKRRFLQEEQF